MAKDSAPIVGIDIGADSIKVVGVASSGGDAGRILCRGEAPTPRGAVEDDCVLEPDRVGAALAGLVARLGLGGAGALAGVSHGPAVVTGLSAAPAGTALDEWARREAERVSPYSLDQAEVAIRRPAAPGRPAQLVVISRWRVAERRAAIEAADLEFRGFELDTFALQRCHEALFPAEAAEAVVLLHVGASFSILHVVRDGESLLRAGLMVSGTSYAVNVAG
jgi:Tfp pilus assembly PilM family ATPase